MLSWDAAHAVRAISYYGRIVAQFPHANNSAILEPSLETQHWVKLSTCSLPFNPQEGSMRKTFAFPNLQMKETEA